MKNIKWLAAFAAGLLPIIQAFPQPAPPPTDPGQPPTAPAVPANFAPAANEVIRLSEAGTTEDVIVAYVQRSTTPFNLSADQIVYLKDIGLSSAVITAMLNRDHDLQSQGQVYNYDQRLYPPANPAAVAPQPISPPPPETAPATPPPAVETPPPVYVSSPPPEVTYFYDDLSPYGTWVELDGYGWCWQPRVVVINHGWRPYCDAGYWVYSDAGWYWQSTYSWGWAPFHYGRWELHPRCGWVWLPDRVWGPAWVVWRSEGDNCGWAPLPPHAEFVAGFGWRFNGVHVGVDFDFGLRPEHFTFVAMRNFADHDLGHRRLAPTEVTRIYNHTTIINNYVVNNNVIVNQGIKVDRVAAATHTQFHKVPIRDVPASNNQMVRNQGISRATPVIYRPQLKSMPAAHPATMVAQKVDNRHPVIQHTPVATARTTQPTMPSRTLRTPATSPYQAQPSVAQPREPQQVAPRRPYSASPSAPSAPPAGRAPSQPTPNRADQGRYSYERTAPESQVAPSRAARPSGQEYNPQVYYPKSYHQAAEIHALPPINLAPERGNSSSRKESGRGQ